MRYLNLGASGLRVSEICLGAMTFGEDWGWGADVQESQKIFNAFVDQGGNFVDTANMYTSGTSEKYCGQFMAGMRDKIVLATKYSISTDKNDPNAGGNQRKNMVQALEKSLQRLNTDYLDLYWLHAWDFTMQPQEVMRALDDLVCQGKILYIGVSDTPAWIVSRANTFAELRGWSRFVGLQIEYSLIQRTPEFDLTPMAKTLDLGVTAWGPLGGGVLTGKYNQGKNKDIDAKRSPTPDRLSERSLDIARAVEKVAKENGSTPTQVALNWLRQQHFQCIPIVGARTEKQILDSMGCLEKNLSAEQMAFLNEKSAVALPFPHSFLEREEIQNLIYGNHKKPII